MPTAAVKMVVVIAGLPLLDDCIVACGQSHVNKKLATTQTMCMMGFMRVQECIAESGLKDAELSRRMGVKVSTIWRWRYGHTQPCYDQIAPLAKALGLKPGDLFDEEAA